MESSTAIRRKDTKKRMAVDNFQESLTKDIRLMAVGSSWISYPPLTLEMLTGG
jgi:hypothetical protein